MNSFKFFSLSCLLFFTLTTCTIFKKEIKKQVTVSISDTLFMATFKTTANYIKYTNLHTPSQVATAFIKGFKFEATNTKNVILKFNDSNADYNLTVKNLVITESSKLETINNPKSEYNGKQVELNSVECSVDIEIINNQNKTKHLMNCTNSKIRSESTTNNRDIGDLISGSNKDNTKYRTKLLNDNICVSLAEDVGRRIWVPITRRIVKTLK